MTTWALVIDHPEHRGAWVYWCRKNEDRHKWDKAKPQLLPTGFDKYARDNGNMYVFDRQEDALQFKEMKCPQLP